MASIFERWRLASKPYIVNVTLQGDASTQVLNMKAKELYQTQDNLQAVVNFLSNSIAQLPLKVYIREGETERRRDRESAAAKLLWRPNPDQTAFEFFRALAVEYFVFGSVFVWLLPDTDSESGLQLRIVPTEWLQPYGGEGNAFAPDVIRICTRNGGTAFDVPRKEFVQFRTYSAGSPGGYLSPISALRQTLTEQVEAGRFRRQLWKSSGRFNAQIIRPKDVEPWTDEQKKKFATAFREAWGAGGSKAGSIPIMEDGMDKDIIHDSIYISDVDGVVAVHIIISIQCHNAFKQLPYVGIAVFLDAGTVHHERGMFNRRESHVFDGEWRAPHADDGVQLFAPGKGAPLYRCQCRWQGDGVHIGA